MKSEDGWKLMEWYRPYWSDTPIQLMRDEWESPILMSMDELNPTTNVVNLYWKPTGIYSRRLESTSMPLRAQLESMYGYNQMIGSIGSMGLGTSPLQCSGGLN